MPPHERRAAAERRAGDGRRGDRGVPDGLLVGGLALLLGLAVLTWTAVGLSAWLSRGRWPDGLSFPRTPFALRRLVTEPRDVAGAWPDVPAGQLSGYGLFWGVFIGQLMVLAVLAVFAVGTVTRGRAVRAARRAGAGSPEGLPAEESRSPGPGPATQPGPASETVSKPRPPAEGPAWESVPEPAAPPHAVPSGPQSSPQATAPAPASAPAAGLVLASPPGAAADAVRDAEGAVVVVTADVSVWSDTVGARTKLGPVHVYDPEQLTDAPARLRWAPHHGCRAMDTARTRAAALLAPVRSPARGDEAVHTAAETLLRCWLHAAAVAGDPFRQVHRWALTGSSQDAVRLLRTDPHASPGAAGELEATLTAHPERSEAATGLVRRALHCLSQLHVRNACTASRSDRIAWESFLPEGGSLYVVGESLEDPYRGTPAAMPLVTALTAAVVEHGRRMAARSSSGRLDPPVTLVLDQPATVAPLRELPWLLADGASSGLVTHALLRSEQQLHTWWPELAAHRP